MDIGVNTETASSLGGGAGFLAAIKLLWNDWRGWQDKRDITKRLDQQDEEIAEHALLNARTLVTKEEHQSLKDHIDEQFDALRKLIIDVIRDSNGRGRKRIN